MSGFITRWSSGFFELFYFFTKKILKNYKKKTIKKIIKKLKNKNNKEKDIKILKNKKKTKDKKTLIYYNM